MYAQCMHKAARCTPNFLLADLLARARDPPSRKLQTADLASHVCEIL